MAGGNPESPSSKRRSFAALFSVTGERGPLSPQNKQFTPRNSTLQVYDTEELGGFTPNSAVPMQASISNTSSNHPSSSDFSMSPHNYFETSMSSPNSSHGFSSGTTPGYDQDMPFAMSTPKPEGEEEDINIDDFIHEPPSRNNTQPMTQASLTPMVTIGDNVFPSPAMTNASINAQIRPNVPEPLATTALPIISNPDITVDDHDATQSSRRTKKRAGDDEAILNRVLPAGRTTAATDDEIPSLRDQELMAKESENHMKVFRWLSGEGSGHLDAPKTNRLRSRSVGQMDGSSKPADAAQGAPAQGFKLEESNDYQPVDGTPRGEGDVLFDDSEEESTDGHTSDEEGLPEIPENELNFADVSHIGDDDIHPPRHIDSIQKMTEEEEMALVNSDPHPNQFYRPGPWHDLPKPISTLNIREGVTRAQPNSSNAAIERWRRANENIETASRVATFGTMRSRRYSIGEMDGLFKRMSFGPNEENLSVVHRPNAHQDRKPSLFEVKNVLKRFSSAGHEHKNAALHALQNLSDKASKEPKPLRKDSQKSKIGRERSPSRLSSLTRKLSKKRKQSDVDPSKDTTSAFATMAGLSMSIGGGEAASSSNPMSPQTKRLSSLNKGKIEFGIPGFISPTSTGRHQSQGSLSVPPFEPLEHEASDEDAPAEPVPTAPPQLKIPIDKITPNRAGFAKHCLQLNPQLHPKLIDRIAIEQVKRFRKLQENFLKHHATVQTSGKCTNEHQCGAVANQGKENNAPVGLLESPNNNASYSMQEYDSDDEDVPSTDGRVTATQFPPGVPMPPVHRLPAEFECTLCFKVKKFTKPSDWTKHVHEDVQPFTCTFPDCTEPKSFKRKADWVRHENEKHRHLEWWTCNLPDCNHKCYRKDNFVQHLVREHKMPEVKVKATKSGATKSGAARGTKKGKSGTEDDEVNKLWDIVAACYKETTNKPTSEPCRFCGCRLQSWKKLTVHLARHMEAISLPVITLIGEDAVLSPASTRRGNSTTVTPITPYNPSAFSAAGQGNITPILPDLQSMYVGMTPHQSSIYSPTRPTPQGVYPSPHATPQRNGDVVGDRIYSSVMDPSLTATLHPQAQFQMHNDLNLLMQEHQHQHAQQQNPMGYSIQPNMGYGMGGHDGILGYSNPNMVAPGLGITNPGQYGAWNQGGQEAGEDETERFMNWPNHHPW
ncbi:uncharacterized protein DFL_003052 [Arthrobotrys flagrans]|uniref:C2H2-type domain-containing protein n=1 Tax=Arthrobotrys flagrans TaxID=97331 RepID=A0A437AC93_ARTFL|nr:hypothetical protein DFL_003052 [Arthrobotrys flagrans]